MRVNVYKNLSLQEMAAHFDISTSYICRLFKMYYSDTPISYYNRIKTEEARTMLNDYPNMKIKDIAEMLGFSDQYYFSKVFKQQYGVTRRHTGPRLWHECLTEFKIFRVPVQYILFTQGNCRSIITLT